MQYKFEESKKLSFKMLHNNYKYHSGTDPHTYLYDAAGNSVWSGTVNLAGTSVSLGTYGKNGSKFFSPYYGGKEHSTYALSYNDEDNNLKISAGINDIKDNWYVSGSGGLLTESPSKSWNISVQKEIFNTEHDKLVVGVDYLFGKTDSADTNLTNWRDRNSKKDIKAFASGKEKTVAAYFENQHRFDDKWKFVLGGRYDSWKNYDGASRYYNKGKLVSDPVLESKRKTMFSPKVALQFRPDEDTSYHVSWGRSFRAPNIFELYKAAPGGTSVTSTYKDSNPDLNPETVDAIEFGIKKQFNKIKKIYCDDYPKFELITYQSYETQLGNALGYSSYFEVLDKMEKDIRKIDFDIALICCGAYGYILSSHIKNMGKSAIELCSYLPNWFGIKIKRYCTKLDVNKHWNKDWIFPVENPIKKSDEIEESCYWE